MTPLAEIDRLCARARMTRAETLQRLFEQVDRDGQAAIDAAVAAYRETVVAWLRAEATTGAVVWAADAIERGEPEAWAQRDG